MSNIGKILEAAGCSFDDVVKCACHLAEVELDLGNQTEARSVLAEIVARKHELSPAG